jgi:hypothetical protein
MCRLVLFNEKQYFSTRKNNKQLNPRTVEKFLKEIKAKILVIAIITDF